MTGVLAGLEEAAGVDFREIEAIVGTSAGSIVGASLVAGRSPRRPRGTAHPRGGSAGFDDAGGRRSGGPVTPLARGAPRAPWAAGPPPPAPAPPPGAPGGARGPAVGPPARPGGPR